MLRKSNIEREYIDKREMIGLFFKLESRFDSHPFHRNIIKV